MSITKFPTLPDNGARKILDEIYNSFQKVHGKHINGRGNWTKAFFEELKKVGFKNRYKVYSSSVKDIPVKKGGGEWLFDLCWSKEEKDWKNNFEGLKLICESEWSMDIDEILHDFQKLAIAKAEIKIMLIQYNKNNTYFEIKRECEKSISKTLRNDNSLYFLVGSGNEKSDEIIEFHRLWDN